MIQLWLRALGYLIVVGAGWLLVLPAAVLYLETGSLVPDFRALPYAMAAAGLFLMGAGLAGWAAYHLIQNGRGTPLPFDPPTRLVTTGPYSYIRNPQAVAMVLMVTAEVIAVASSILWVALLLTLAYLEGIAGPWEDRQLFRRFNRAYAAYSSRVPKWLPRWRRG